MSDNTTDSGWLDEHHGEVQPGLTCHIELEIDKGETFREIFAKAAKALRAAAVSLEAGKFDDGFHPVTTLDGEELGEIYIDYHGTM